MRHRPDERLKCPLYHCFRRFPDHEAMLNHLYTCDHLGSGEYYCHDHERVENFDDVKCKRCTGHPSRRKWLVSRAKSLFHSFGHKSKRAESSQADLDNASLLPPSYDSLSIMAPDGTFPTELLSTEIMEIDSREITNREPVPAPAVIDPQALLVPAIPAPSLPELDSTTTMSDSSFLGWPSSSAMPPSYPLACADGSRAQGFKPCLQLDTSCSPASSQPPRSVPRPVAPVPSRSKGLSPSSSVRSTASTDTTATTSSNTSAMLSPASIWSTSWSVSGINTNMTSPIDGLLADDAFAEALGHPSNPCPELIHEFYCELPADLPGDFPGDLGPSISAAGPAPDAMASDPIMFNFDFMSLNAMPYAANVVMTDESVDLPEVDAATACCSEEVKTLIGDAWDVLQEHILSSMDKIQGIKDNPLAGRLGQMSAKTIASAGLDTLRGLIQGRRPGSTMDLLCFVHLVYSMWAVMHRDETMKIPKPLFFGSVSHTSSLPPGDQASFRELVCCIWQPPDVSEGDIDVYVANISRYMMNQFSDSKGKSPEVAGFGSQDSDYLVATARNFLDGRHLPFWSSALSKHD